MAGILGQVTVSCDFSSDEKLDCEAMVLLQTLKPHVASCRFRSSAAPHSPLPRVVTPSTTVREILTASSSKLQGNMAKRLTSQLVAAQEQDRLIELRAGTHGGRPQAWLRLTR